ncbi:UNVERIFIED_CONTAM: hypothetical protein Sangu_1369400 [Sesamum angustifolium]|uniref:Uncharacterized protein n=1 Tax=Sesamum angustifolium TaxID=2727405 RepID=A0AAW2N5Y8_9LAMI
MNTAEELEPGPISALKRKHPTYAIGPIFPSHFTNRAVEMNLWSESDCNRWLDGKPPGSVLFIFGAQPDIYEFQGQRLYGFQENVGNKVGRAMVQTKTSCYPILLSEILDALWVEFDTGEHLGRTAAVCFSFGELVSSDEVAERIKLLMRGETSNELRKNVVKLRKKLENALGSNGASQMNFDKFVEDVRDRMERRKDLILTAHAPSLNN